MSATSSDGFLPSISARTNERSARVPAPPTMMMSMAKSRKSPVRSSFVDEAKSVPKGRYWDSNLLMEGDAESHLGEFAGVAQLPFSRLLAPLQKRSTIYERRQCAYSFATYTSDKSSISDAWEQIMNMENQAGFRSIVALITDSDFACQRYGSLAMQLLAQRPEALPQLNKVAAIEHVLPRALIMDDRRKNWDSDAQRYCIMACENMTMDPDRHLFIMGFLNEIVHMIERPPHPSYRVSFKSEASAIGICRNLAISPRFRPNLLPAVRVTLALMKSSTQTIECRTKAADFLSLVSRSDHAKAFLMQRRIFPIIVEIVEQCTGDPAEARMLGNTALIISNLVLVVESHEALLRDDMLLTMMVLGSMTHVVDCLISVCRVSHILSSYSRALDSIVHLKGIEIVLQAFFLCEDVECRLAALGFVANLSHHPRFYERLVLNQAMEAISIGLQSKYTDCLPPAIEAAAFFTRHAAYQKRIQIDQVLPRVFRILNDTSKFVLGTRDFAIVTLANIASDPNSHGIIITLLQQKHEPGFLAIPRCAEHDETSLYWGKLMCNLLTTEDKSVRAHLSRSVVVQAAAGLLQSSNVSIVKCCLVFLLGLVRDHTQVALTIVQHFYSSLKYVARLWCSDTYHYLVAALVANLTRSTQVVAALPWADWLDLVQHLLSEPYDKIARKGMEFLLNIADLDDVQRDIAQSDLIDRIFASIDHSFPLALHILVKFSSGILALRRRIAERNIVGALSRLLLARSRHWRKYALICIGNFCSMPETPLPLSRINLVKHLIDLADDSHADLEECRFCAYAIANMSFHECNRQDLLDSASFLFRKIPILVETGDTVVLRGLAQFLLNICYHLRDAPMFGSNLVVQTILRVARYLDTVSKVFAIQALHCMAEVPRNGRAFVQGGVVQFLKDEGLDYKRRDAESTRQMCRFMSYACLIRDVASACSQQELVPTLVYLMTHPDQSVQLDVLKVMVSMAKDATAQDGLVKDAMVVLVGLLEDEHPDKRQMAALAIGFVICRLDAQRLVARFCRDSIYRDLLCSAHAEVSLIAVWMMAHLIHRKEKKNGDPHKRGLGLDPDEHDGDALTDEECERNRVLAIHVIGKLAEIALSPDADPTLSKYATLAVVRFSSSPDLQPALIQQCGRIVEEMFEISSSLDPEMRPVMVTLLANLSRNPANHAFLERNVDVSRLDLMVGGDDPETQAVAISAVSGLAISSGNAQQMVDGGRILPIVSAMCTSDDPFKLQSIGAVLVNLSDHDRTCRLGMLKQQAVMGIMALLQAPAADHNTHYNACRALSNLLQEPEGIKALGEHDHDLVSSALWSVIGSKSAMVVGVALRILCFLGGRDDFLFLMNNVNGIRCLIGVAEVKSGRTHDNDNCEFHSAVVLRACCETPRLIPMLVENGIVRTLIGLSRAVPRPEEAPVHLLAVTSLEDVIRYPNGKRAALDARIDLIGVLLACLNKGHAELVLHTLAVVLHLSDQTSWSAQFNQAQGWGLIVPYLRDQHDQVRRMAVRCVAAYSAQRTSMPLLMQPEVFGVVVSQLKATIGVDCSVDEAGRFSDGDGVPEALSLIGIVSNVCRVSDAGPEQNRIDLESLALVTLLNSVLTQQGRIRAQALHVLAHRAQDQARAHLFAVCDNAMIVFDQLFRASHAVRRILTSALDQLCQCAGNYQFMSIPSLFALAQAADDENGVLDRWICLKAIYQILAGGDSGSVAITDAQKVSLIVTLLWRPTTPESGQYFHQVVECRRTALAIILHLSLTPRTSNLVDGDVMHVLLEIVSGANLHLFYELHRSAPKSPASIRSWPVDPLWQHWSQLTVAGVVCADRDWNQIPVPPVPPFLEPGAALPFDLQLRIDAVTALANLAVVADAQVMLLERNAVSILLDFLDEYGGAVFAAQRQAVECLALIVQSLSDEHVRRRFVDINRLGAFLVQVQAQERRCKKGSVQHDLRCQALQSAALTVARITAHRAFTLDGDADRAFVSGGSLYPLLKATDTRTQHWAFIALVNVVIKGRALHSVLYADNIVEQLLRFLRERDDVIQWLALYALAELFDQSGIGADHLIRHSLLTVVISLAYSEAIRHLIQSMTAPIDFLTTSDDAESAAHAAQAKALLIEAGPRIRTVTAS